MALVLNGVKYLVLHQAEEGIFITGCFNKSWNQGLFRTETGTQMDGNRDAASIDGGHRSLVSSYPCQEQREKHPAGRCTMC